ncbi:hypothetical protein DSM21852_22530 [Methylocystis bryophila]|nr:hypothetical protein DSM21852_22530 [Methylocystis bryophila]
MKTVTVYCYETRSHKTQEWVRSRRMATQQFILSLSREEVRILDDSAVEIDELILDSNGQTPLDFDPRA